ncbi:GAF domain-containing sensor histidine kinase [Paenibacillus sp. 2TAB19]|uniref:GAF domain-containing sensor histidine kinase n=1 Tax=Paenibacillus sp. 2TAB19 TaxID=3233003 RepID=UPI003F9891AA
MSSENRTNQLSALKEIAELLNTTNDMKQMLSEVLGKLLQVTGFSTGWIFMMDESMESECQAAYGLPPALAANGQEAMCGEDCWCIERYRRNKLPHAVNTIECKRITYAIAEGLEEGTLGISHHATVPLKAGKDKFGLLNVAHPGKECFTEDELALLQAIAFQIGTAIKRIRLYQSQEQNALHYSKLSDVIQRIHAIGVINELPIKAVQEIGNSFNWPHVSLFIYENGELSLRAFYTEGEAHEEWKSLSIDDNGPISTAFRHNKLFVVSNAEHTACPSLERVGIPLYASAAAIPLRVRNRSIGVLFISSPIRGHFDEYHEDFMYSLGDHYTLCVENLRVYEQRRELARMEERYRVARDLHDSVMQKVFSLSFIAKGAETLLQDREGNVRASLKEIQQLSQETLKEMRSLIWQLHPAGLENGLLSALKQHGQSMGLTIYEQVSGLKQLPRAVEEALWRIGQEALNNVRKHSGTVIAYVKLVLAEGEVTLEVMDKGNGFSLDNRKGGLTLGMLSMRERAEQLGGQFNVRSNLGGPTVIAVKMPLDQYES